MQPAASFTNASSPSSHSSSSLLELSSITDRRARFAFGAVAAGGAGCLRLLLDVERDINDARPCQPRVTFCAQTSWRRGHLQIFINSIPIVVRYGPSCRLIHRKRNLYLRDDRCCRDGRLDNVPIRQLLSLQPPPPLPSPPLSDQPPLSSPHLYSPPICICPALLSSAARIAVRQSIDDGEDRRSPPRVSQTNQKQQARHRKAQQHGKSPMPTSKAGGGV